MKWNQMTFDQQLAVLDPAARVGDGLVHEPKAREALHRIMNEEADASVAVDRPTRSRISEAIRGRSNLGKRRLIAVGATAASAVAASTFLTGGTAYASWTATPRLASSAEQSRWGADCLTRWSDHNYQVDLVEMRGPYAYVVLGSADGFEATCLMKDNGANAEVTGGGFSAPLTQEPAADGLVTNSVRAQSEGADAEFEVTGKAGRDVAAIEFEANGTQVHASLKDGRFAAWWPGGSSLIPQWGPPNPTVKITLVDGTTRVAKIQDFDVSPS